MAKGGVSAAAAYGLTYPGTAKATAETNGPRLLRNAQVCARVAEIQDAAAARVAFTRAEAMKFLADVIRTAPAELHEGHPLCQRVVRTERGNVTTVSIALPSKLAAFDLLAKMNGWYEPEARPETDGRVVVIVRQAWGSPPEEFAAEDRGAHCTPVLPVSFGK